MALKELVAAEHLQGSDCETSRVPLSKGTRLIVGRKGELPGEGAVSRSQRVSSFYAREALIETDYGGLSEDLKEDLLITLWVPRKSRSLEGRRVQSSC